MNTESKLNKTIRNIRIKFLANCRPADALPLESMSFEYSPQKINIL
jgi:hypothetical protein